MRFPTSLRLASVSALMILLSACGSGDDGADLASPGSDINATQIDAALGPADQRAIRDAGAGAELTNEEFGNEAETNTAAGTAAEGEEQQ